MLLVAGIGIYYGYFADVPLRISRETTYITEPLTPDGKHVDYWAAAEQAMYPPGMATEDNGYRMIVQALGPNAANTPDEVRQIYEKLGLNPAPPSMTFEDPNNALTRLAQAEAAVMGPNFEQILKRRIEMPWTLEDLPQMETWLVENGPALELMADAVRKPEFQPPWAQWKIDRLVTASLNELQQLRHFAPGFEVRARYRLGTGDVDGAIDDIVSCARLGRRLRDTTACLENLVGIAIEARAFSVGAGESLAAQPSADQWRRLLNELNQLPAREYIIDPDDLLIERLMILDVFQSISQGESIAWAQEVHLWPPRLTEMIDNRAAALDWNIVFQRFHQHFDDTVAGKTMPRPNLDGAQNIISRAERSRVMADVLTFLQMPAIEQFKEACRRSVCKENLLRIAIAMLLYEKQHGTLPPAYSVDGDGQPLHSWRVLILPYLGYDELYSQIRLDEPWDSTHNSQLHSADVPIYQCPSGFDPPGQTIYTVIEGQATAFLGGEGKRLDAFGPNSANLILVAERLDPVCWMDPMLEVPFAIAALGINLDGAANGLGSEHIGGLHTALRSGAVRFFSENITLEELRGLLEGTIEQAP